MIAYAFFHEKYRFWAVQTHFCKFSEFRPCLSPDPWFGLWGSLVWNIVTCQNGLKSLETFQKWSRMPFFMKISFWTIQTHFFKFSEFHPCLSPNPWFGLWGSLVWNMVTCQNGFKSLETLQNDRVSLLSRKKSFQASQIHFCSFQNFALV